VAALAAVDEDADRARIGEALDLLERPVERVMASWLLTACHSRTERFHPVEGAFSARWIDFAAASSDGTWPRVRTARLIFEFSASLAFVV
jgi:hypothetical protein